MRGPLTAFNAPEGNKINHLICPIRGAWMDGTGARSGRTGLRIPSGEARITANYPHIALPSGKFTSFVASKRFGYACHIDSAL